MSDSVYIPDADVVRSRRPRIIPASIRRTSPRAALLLQAFIGIADVIALIAAVTVTRRMDPLGILFIVVAFCIMRGLGTQTSHITLRLADSIARILGAIAVSVVGVGLVHGSAASAGRFLVLGPVAAALVLAVRGFTNGVIRTARARGLIREPTLIVGAGEVGREVAKALQEHPEYGLVPIGFIDSVDQGGLPLEVLGRVEQLGSVVSEWGVQRVIVAFGSTREPSIIEVIRAAEALPVEVHLVPRFFELGVSAHGPHRDEVWGIPLIRVRRSALRTVAWRMKRMVDLVVGSFLLALASPLMLAATVAVALSSPGPILLRQVRIGQRGRPFHCLKFRTLRLNEGSDVEWSVADDRVTGVGRILRHSSLDELPQLINVLQGNMSLVGPRPERPFFVERFSQEVSRYDDRHRVPVGITGWAQIHGLRGDTSIPERIRFDNYYIEHWSPWLDTVIIFRTIWLIITGRH